MLGPKVVDYAVPKGCGPKGCGLCSVTRFVGQAQFFGRGPILWAGSDTKFECPGRGNVCEPGLSFVVRQDPRCVAFSSSTPTSNSIACNFVHQYLFYL